MIDTATSRAAGPSRTAAAKPRRAHYPDARSTSLRRYRSTARFRGWLARTVLIASAATSAVVAPVAAQSVKEAGVGVVAGYPVGGTAKLWLDRDLAIDAGAGFAGDAVFWGDLLYHRWDVLPQPKEGKLALYFGGGPRLRTSADAQFGLRAIAGAAWRMSSRPLEFFVEAGPVFRLTQGGAVDADGGLGVRVYLGR